MTTSVQTIVHKKIIEISPARKISMGIIEILLGLFIYFVLLPILLPMPALSLL